MSFVFLSPFLTSFFVLPRLSLSASHHRTTHCPFTRNPFPCPLPLSLTPTGRRGAQIANVGFLDVDPLTVGNAVASETMFIHGSLSGGGGSQFVSDRARAAAAATALAKSGGKISTQAAESLRLTGSSVAAANTAVGCRPECGSSADSAGSADGRPPTVCDPVGCRSAAATEGWSGLIDGGKVCGAGDEERYGSDCRRCYVDTGEALEAERLLESQARQAGLEGGRHVIMCDTLRPPQSTNCSLKCATKVDTVSYS